MDTTTASATEHPRLYEHMYRIRRFEERVADLYREGAIPGFVHLAVGQEATAVGACAHLRPGDVITSTHRGHGHALARGLSPLEIFAELMAKETGVCRGRGGSMHIADPARGIFGANGIVGAGIPIAVGAAFAAGRRGNGVVVAFFGDGAVASGAFHEAANLASLWGLPIILFCENNGYSEFSTFEEQHPVPLRERAAGYGLPYHAVDGNDVVAVAGFMQDALEEARAGRPQFVEARTYRLRGHYEGDPERYRSSEDVDAAGEGDPLRRSRDALLGAGVSAGELDAIERRIDDEVDEAATTAAAQDDPDPAALFRGVVTERTAHPEPEHPPAATTTWKMHEAIRQALQTELEEDPSVFLAGIDVGRGGNVFGITRGLHKQWPDRVRDTPISETAIMGLGVGAALAGLRPVVEIMYFDFIGVCFDQVLNQAAKLRYMTGGLAELPLTVRTQFGAGRSSGAQHSQSLEALLAHIPGLTVLMPSSPADAFGLLRAAIRDPNPVIFVENRLLYGVSGPTCDPDTVLPIGKASVRRPGEDITVVSYSRMVNVCLEAAAGLAEQDVSCEVLDLRTVAPLDLDAVLASVQRTGRLLIVHEAVRDFGVGAEIAARVAEEAFWQLDAPIRRVGAAPTPAPYSPVLERAWLPDKDRVTAAARDLVAT